MTIPYKNTPYAHLCMINTTISIVIPYKDDGPIILDSVSRLLNIPDVEIIIVDDGSYEPLTPLVAVPDNVRVITHSRNVGVGAAFDTGVKHARGETLLLMGADVMQQEGWVDHVRRIAEANPKGIVSAACVGVTADNGYALINPPRAGATIRLKQDAQSRDDWFKQRRYNDILLGAWIEPTCAEFTKVPCLMGASYVVSKEWYVHLRGFNGHRFWGGLEPMISIKSWRAGGYVATDPSWVVAHVFGVNGGERDPQGRRAGRIQWYYYNKILIAYTCLPGLYKELVAYLGAPYAVGEAKQLFKQHRAEIDKIRAYNESIFTEGIEVLGL